MFRFEVVFFAILAVCWTVAYFVWFRPWLKTYRYTAGLYAGLHNREMAFLTWLGLRFQGIKSALILFVTSLFTGGWGLIEAAFGVDPSSLMPFQDSTIWKALLRDDLALKAAAITTFAAAFLTLYGKVRDIKIQPKPGAN